VRYGFVILDLSACALLFGVWRGEDLSDPLPKVVDLGGGLIWVVTFLLVSLRKPERRRAAIAYALFVPAALAVGYVAGDRIGARALNECISEGESIRVALHEFYGKNGRYPVDLASLHLQRVPGGRLLRGGILNYTRTGEGYSLNFGDYMVSYVATESTPFLGAK